MLNKTIVCDASSWIAVHEEQNTKILALYAQVHQLTKNSAKDAILDVKDIKALLGPDFLDKIEDISEHK